MAARRAEPKPLPPPPSWRRHALGGLAIVLVAVAFWLQLFPSNNPAGKEFEAACLRMGLLAGVIWLAFPQVSRAPPWLWLAIFVVFIVLAVRPRAVILLVYLIPVFWALWFLAPRPKR